MGLLVYEDDCLAPLVGRRGAEPRPGSVVVVRAGAARHAYDRSKRRVVRHSDEVWDANASAAVCDVFEYTRPTRGLWRLFELPGADSSMTS